ncbi:MAG: hypothetical protein A2V66_00230 [Ignavibacteria bacterium RBG_13_36_8]|nr:MAG: hypothetical protein A2V66_00230 [Ignavibacteria bacterium RBG_13_36_8]
MKLTIGFLLITLLIYTALDIAAASSFNENDQNDSLTVENVIEKYVNACGGEALKQIKTEFRKGSLVRFRSGQVPLNVIAKAPDKWYYNQIFAWGDQVSYGFDGSTAWVQTTRNIENMPLDQFEDMQLLFGVHSPLKLKKLYPVMTLKRKEKIGEKEVITIIAKSLNGNSTELAFEIETGLLARVGDIFFEDYRDIGNIKRPFRILLGRDQGEEHKQMKIQFTEILLDQDVDEAVFELPQCVLPVVDAPLYKSRKQFTPTMESMDMCVGIYQNPEKPENKYRIFREEGHLFIDLIGRNFKIEIIPESDIDYYTKFLGWDFHFVKNEIGVVTELIINSSITVKAVKIN